MAAPQLLTSDRVGSNRRLPSFTVKSALALFTAAVDRLLDPTRQLLSELASFRYSASAAELVRCVHSRNGTCRTNGRVRMCDYSLQNIKSRPS